MNDDPYEMTYRVDGMTCEHCRRSVSEAVEEVAGVRAVDVDLDSKLVRVGGANVDDAEVRVAIGVAGYEARPA